MKTDKIIKLINASYIKDYMVELRFDDNVVRQIDFGGFLHSHSHPQYDKYKRLSNFRKFKIERNNLVWGRNWDLIFDTWDLYQGKNPK